MVDLGVSLLVLGAAVLLCEAARRAAARLLPGPAGLYLQEAASTFQLCCCTLELQLLGVDLPVSLALTYGTTLVHLLTFREATCNPGAVLERAWRGDAPRGAAVPLLLAAQFGAAAAARSWAACVWSLGLSAAHRRHRGAGFLCSDPLGGTVPQAAAAELACAFAVQAAAMHAHKLDEKLRAHFMAAVITAVVHTGGDISGAVFNPVLAFSVTFPCSGHTYLEYCFVYWLGPILGMASCILLFEKILPLLSGMGAGAAAQKLKTQ
ncbi:aquaporin-11-like [Cololabis saira]|uniref:aquaporin-11-like n=1 Tax=Cololabis saira TaxID=129043 RepID=UPI002AD4354A|nr:aquaporin-11-like [Cololabis saira]